MTGIGKRTARVLLLVAGSVALGSCVEEDVVFDERPIYQQVAAAAGGFVGYADPSSDDKLTFCGACHVDVQARWEITEHAHAWDGLQSSDHAQAFCEACHTVNSLGNVVAEPSPGEAVGGHVAYQGDEGRYLDVQCESCHGPGLAHVLAPGAANVPLAPIETGVDLGSGCGECHRGTHHPFVEEWELSAHADPNVGGSEADGCFSCHSGEGGLLRLGVTTDYLEKDELLGSDHYAGITCAVCHDPHGSDNEAQLRLPITNTSVAEHLCAACHDRYPRPDTDGRQEYLRTHAPDAGLLAGAAGWFPPGSGLVPGQITHAHTEAERLCASCHAVGYSTVDEATGQEFFSTGHRFLAIPCVDPATGLPTETQSCAMSAEVRDFRGCAECHASGEETAALLQAATSELLPRMRTLVGMLSRIDPNGRAPGGEIDPDDFRFTVAEGAYFTMTVALSGDGLPVSDAGARRTLAAALTHNPALVGSIVDAALAALRAEYPAAASLTYTGWAAGWDDGQER